MIWRLSYCKIKVRCCLCDFYLSDKDFKDEDDGIKEEEEEEVIL